MENLKPKQDLLALDSVALASFKAASSSIAEAATLPDSREGLADALAHEVAVAASPSPASSPKASQVVLSHEGKAHAILIGIDVSLVLASTFCGWRFGGTRARIAPFIDLPADYKNICGKCFPGARAVKKAELAEAASRLG